MQKVLEALFLLCAIVVGSILFFTIVGAGIALFRFITGT